MKISTCDLWRMVALSVLPLLVCISSIAQPVITGFSPAAGGPPGATVTINGSGFDPIASNNIVRFGALSATVTAATATQLTVTAPIAASYAKISVAKGGFVAESIQNYSTTIPMTNTLNSTSFQHLLLGDNPINFSNIYRNQVATDIDGDGIMDIVAHLNAEKLVFLRGSGTGTFAATQTPLIIYKFLVVDLDGDGKKDLVTTNGTDVSTYRNTSTPGSISFGPQTPQASPPNGAYSLAYGDFNRDSKIDIVTAGTSDVYIFGNNSTVGSISLAGGGLNRAITDEPSDIAAEDLNNDGFYELIVVSRTFNTVSLLGNKATVGTLASGTMDLNFTSLSLFGLTLPTKIATGDLTNDGFNDIVVTSEGAAAKVAVWRNLGLSAPVTASSFATIAAYSIAGNNTPKSVKLADLDADGKVDIVMSASVANQGAPFIQRNNYSGSGNFTNFSFTVGSQQSSIPYNSPKSEDVLPIDVDGDGRIDLAVFASDNWSSLYVYKNQIKANQTISTISPMTKAYGDAPFNVNVTSTSGLPVTLTSSNPSVATISGNTITIVGVGVTYITGSQSGNSIFNPATNNGVGDLLTVTKGTQIITWPPIPQLTFGDPLYPITASSNSGAPLFSYSSSNLSVANDNTANAFGIVGAGTVTITVTFPSTANYFGPASASQTITINKANQTINFAALPTKTFGNAPYALSAPATSGLPVTFSSSAPGTVSITGNTATILAAGSADITATQLGNANYNAATSVIRTQVVNKANQTITFNALSTKTFGDAAYNLTATTSSGLTPTYTSSNPAVATVSGSTVTIIGAGSTVITASQSGNPNYNAATDVTQTLTVNKANQTITFNALSAKTFGDAAFNLTATASSTLTPTYASSNPAVATVSGSTVTIIGAGSTVITASQSGNPNYNAATDVTQTLTVNKANQTITFNALAAKTFGDVPYTLISTASSGLAVSFSSNAPGTVSITGNTATILAAGSADITASQAGNANYNPATSVIRTQVVNKANQTITFNALSAKTFGDAAFNLSATTSSGLTPTYTSSNPAVATVSGSTVTIIGVGSAVITASQSGNPNYNAATDVTQTLTVNKANQTITFNALSAKTFGDAAFNLTATASSSLPVSYTSSNTAVATVSGNTVTIVGAGSTTITASQIGNSNYNAATDATQTLTVNKANQTITFNALAAKTFGDADFTLTATASSGLAPITYASSNTGVATVIGNTVTIVGAGSTTITASRSGNANYNDATPAAQPLTVNKANQTITFNSLSTKTFGDATFNLTATASSGLTPNYTTSNPAVATVSGSTVTIVGAGSTVITASQSGDSNYNSAANKTQTLTVNKSNQSITFGPLTPKTFIDLPFSLNAEASSSLAVSYSSSNTLVATVNGSTITIVGVGNTLITASQAGDDNYNGATSVSQSLTVNKADQTIFFGAIGAKNQSDLPFQLTGSTTSGLTITYTSSNTSVATISGNTVTIVAPGTTDITASQGGNANFNAATNVVRSLVVNTKTAQTITFASLSNKVFGDPNFNLSATASSGLPVSFTSSNPAVATVSGNTVTIVAAGTTNIVASQSGDNTFNNATDVIRSLVVSKANQTINFAALGQVSITQGSVPLSATSSVGLPIVFSSSNNSVATVNGTTLTLNGIGSANITAEQTGNNNYNSATAVSTIVVSAKLSQTIAFTPIPDKIIGGSSFSLTATASSNLPIVFTTTSDKVSIAGNVVTILKAGRVVITATQAGDNIYNAASIDQSFCIAPATLTITISNNFSDTPTLTASTAANYQWYKNNVLIPGATSQTFSVTDIGQYKVSTKADDCSNTSDVFAIVVTANEPVLPNSDLPVEVFPNPADDYFHVHGIIGKFEYRLSSIIGSTIPIKLEKEGADYKGYIGSLPQGYYVLTIKQPTRTQSIKILKK